jgi:hypothetical protein
MILRNKNEEKTSMKFKVVVWASVVLLAAVPAFSQRAVRTVTNLDLEMYRQERLKGEREYAQNYEKLGFPSPEELQKQLEKNQAEREALAARIAGERLQREQIQAGLAEAEMAEAERRSQETVIIVPQERGDYFGFPPGYYPNGRYSRRYPNWPRRLGNGIPYYGPRTIRPRYPRRRRGR